MKAPRSLPEEKGIKAANLKQAYVSNSRFRLSQTILTTDTARAQDAMGAESERPLALEMIKADWQSKLPLPGEKTVEAIQPPERSDQRITSADLDWTPFEKKRAIGIG